VPAASDSLSLDINRESLYGASVAGRGGQKDLVQATKKERVIKVKPRGQIVTVNRCYRLSKYASRPFLLLSPSAQLQSPFANSAHPAP
jgi:hypothetical protein